MGNVATYNSKLVTVTVGGNLMTGVGEGDFCEIEFDEDAFKKMIGADGTGSRSRNANEGGIVKVTLQQTSPSNDVLSTLAENDRLLGTGVSSVLVKDVSGRTVCSASNGWVKRMPANKFSKDQGSITWEIDCIKLVRHIGGNNPN